MKKCKCGSRDFSVIQKHYVKFLLDGNLKIVGNTVRIPKIIDGFIKCEQCGEQYTDITFEDLEE